MDIQIISLLENVINPTSGKTLKQENRVIEVNVIDGFLNFRYQRDGITPLDKRDIEKQILNVLEGKWDLEKVKIYTVSERSQDVFNSIKAKQDGTPSEQPAAVSPVKNEEAQIKVGHGTVGNKRSVPGVKHLVAIGSGKGGVGKSTFTVNLAFSLKNLGFNVGIIDADIYGPSLPMLMGMRSDKPRSNADKKIIPLEKEGVKFISFGLFINEDDPVIWRGPMLGGVLNQFLFDVEWGGLDFLLIDLPPGTGDIQLSMVQNANVDGAIVISTPQDVALLDATKGLQMFKKMNLPIVGMVENMSYFMCEENGMKHYIFGKGGVSAACQKLELTMLGEIALDEKLRENSDRGTPYMSQMDNQNKTIWQSYMGAAQKVVNHFGAKPSATAGSKGGLFSKLFGK
jgi:ATP-binding protein involved in chromosome partitioning